MCIGTILPDHEPQRERSLTAATPWRRPRTRTHWDTIIDAYEPVMEEKDFVVNQL